MIMRRFEDAVKVGFDGVEYAARTGLERRDAALLYFNHSESLSAVGRADEALAFARRASEVGHGASSFTFGAGKYHEALLHLWADNVQEHEHTLRSLAPTLVALADSLEVTMHIQALKLDGAAAASHDAPPAGRVARLSEALAGATSLFSDELDSQPDTIRMALVSVTRAQALLARLGETIDKRIAERVDELVGLLVTRWRASAQAPPPHRALSRLSPHVSMRCSPSSRKASPTGRSARGCSCLPRRQAFTSRLSSPNLAPRTVQRRPACSPRALGGRRAKTCPRDLRPIRPKDKAFARCPKPALEGRFSLDSEAATSRSEQGRPS